MKEIGSKLKEKREENGLTIDEASEDLKVRPSQLSNLEEGKKEEFSDVLFLKYLIRDYSKYLGLDGEKMVDEFNEFLFDFTSKIPLEEIEIALEEKKKEGPKITSPYTSFEQEKNKIPKLLIALVIVLLVVFGGYLIISNMSGNDFHKENVTYVIGR